MFKKRKKRKIINGCKGALSILLCLLLTPFLSVASVLIEYSRYQSTTQTLHELIDLSTLSTISDYDEYVNDRFGLFSISQDNNISENFNNNFNNNIGMLGKSITTSDSHNAIGSYPLSNLDILKTQVIDFSETTVMTELLLKEFKIEELLQALDGLKGLSNLATDAADLATSVADLVEEGEKFIEAIQSAYDKASEVKDNVQDFLDKVADLYKKLSENGIAINDDTNYDDIISDYLSDFKGVYASAKTLFDSITGFSTAIGNLPTELTKFKTALTKATSSSSATSGANTDTGGGASSLSVAAGAGNKVFEEILNEIEGSVDSAVESVKETTINSLKSASSGLKDELYGAFKLDKYLHLDDYLSLPLSNEAKSDIKEILKEVPTVWTTGSYDEVLNKIKSIYIPDAFDISSFSNTLYNIKDTIFNAISNAETSLKSDMESGLVSTLRNLMDAVNALFGLNVFYDNELDAFLSDDCYNSLPSVAAGYTNPYATFLDGISSFFESGEEFIDSIGGFKNLKAIAKLLKSIVTMLTSIVELVTEKIDKIVELVGYVQNGNLTGLYELMLMSAYLTYNMPNRTDYSAGEALTGYSYNDIAVPPINGLPSFGFDPGISGLASFLSNMQDGGSNTMFRGAQLEYIMAGTKSEIMNQTVTFMDLYFLRLLLDIPAVFMDNGVKIMATDANIASLAVYLLVIMAEPLVDTVLLVNGGPVCLVKTKCYLSPLNLTTLADQLIQVTVSNPSIKNAALSEFGTGNAGGSNVGLWPIDYSSHVILLLMFSKTEAILMSRLADIIQLESKSYYSNSGASFDFDINKTYTCITTDTTVTYNSFLSIFEFNDTSVFTKTYKKSRGY